MEGIRKDICLLQLFIFVFIPHVGISWSNKMSHYWVIYILLSSTMVCFYSQTQFNHQVQEEEFFAICNSKRWKYIFPATSKLAISLFWAPSDVLAFSYHYPFNHIAWKVSERGKMRTRITPNTDTFYAVPNTNISFCCSDLRLFKYYNPS